MRKKLWVSLALLLLIPAFMFAASCAKKQIVSEPGISEDEEAAEARRLAAEREAQERQRALEEQRLREQQLADDAKARTQQEIRAARAEFLDEHIYFEFDKSRLLPESKAVLRMKAEWLKANPVALAIIEGHCDERGTNEYNMALGDRRAQSAKTYLVDLGIAAERLTCISYGEERPLDPGHDEAAWAKNRRAQFVIE
ncbi:MAG: peptidoglycan-associated lipoprotein Pal [Deltaproteobacteria bacterium]|jgi:peptidoglycan-associated lipoprotein